MATELPSIGRTALGNAAAPSTARLREGHALARGCCGACESIFSSLKSATEASSASTARPVLSAGRVGETPAGSADEGRRAGVIVRLSGGKVVPVDTESESTTSELKGRPNGPGTSGEPALEADERREIEQLRRRDREVRAHEQAHKTTAGPHGGAVSLTYTTGPDGARYAVSGEVPVDLSPVSGDPAATVRKMTQIRQAALAPADPSSADRAAASRASTLQRKARAELAEMQAQSMQAALGTVRSNARVSRTAGSNDAVSRTAGSNEVRRAAPEPRARPEPPPMDVTEAAATGRTAFSFYA